MQACECLSEGLSMKAGLPVTNEGVILKMLFVTKITTAHISGTKKNYNVKVYVAPFNLILERERRELSKIPFILNLDSTISKIFLILFNLC